MSAIATMSTTRTVDEDELDDLLALYQHLNPDDPELERSDELRDQWRTMLDDDTLDVVVVERDGELVASCVLSVTRNLTRGARPFAVVENVVTHRAHRGNGHGSRCLQHALSLADQRDCYKVMLLTGSDRQWKHEFYESNGFDGDDKTGFVRYLPED